MFEQGANVYQHISGQTSVCDADPQKLISIVFENAINKLSIAKGNMQRRQINEKGMNIGAAISSIELLQSVLDKECNDKKHKELIMNLNELYQYMLAKLLQANLHNDILILDEVSSLLRVVHDGWANASLSKSGE